MKPLKLTAQWQWDFIIIRVAEMICKYEKSVINPKNILRYIKTAQKYAKLGYL